MPRIGYDEVDKYESSNGEWFQLKNDGDVARVQFMMDSLQDLEIYACHRVKIGDKERYVDCLRSADESIDLCPLCAAGNPVKPVRFIIMLQHDDNKVKIWERGKTFISKLQGLFNRYTPLSNYVFEIERHGKAGDKETKYDIYPMDRVEKKDLTNVEYPELLGGLILEKDFDELAVFVRTGKFPEDVQTQAQAAPVVDRRSARRVEVQDPQPAREVGSRRESPKPAEETLRGPSRGRRGPGDTKNEVF